MEHILGQQHEPIFCDKLSKNQYCGEYSFRLPENAMTPSIPMHQFQIQSMHWSNWRNVQLFIFRVRRNQDHP